MIRPDKPETHVLHSFDDTDKAIVEALKKNARLSLRQLAQCVHMSAPSVAERLHRLEEQNIITGYTIQIDQCKLTPAYFIAYMHIFLHAEGDHKAFLAFAEKREEIKECYRTAGESCYLLKVHITDHKMLNSFLDALQPYGNYRLHLVVSEVFKKE